LRSDILAGEAIARNVAEVVWQRRLARPDGSPSILEARQPSQVPSASVDDESKGLRWRQRLLA